MKKRRKSYVYLLMLLCLLPSTLLACSSSQPASTPVQPTVAPTQQITATPSETPQATQLPSGTVLYTADFSHGLPAWQNLHGWKIVQGGMEADTGGRATFVLPYTPKITNFEIEAHIQIVRLVQENGGYLSFSAPQLPNANGYATGISGMEGTQARPNGAHPAGQISLIPQDAAVSGTGLPIDYEPHFADHVYQVEVQDNEVSLYLDGVSLVSVSSNQTATLSPGPISFTSDLLILHITSLRILAL